MSLCYDIRTVRAMFIDEPVGELDVRSKISYQITLGTFSAALLLFGIWWPPSSGGHIGSPR